MHYEGHIKMGRYPQSERMINLLASLIEVLPNEELGEQKEKIFKIFEPCCDKGIWAKTFKDTLEKRGVHAVTYGIELNKKSYEGAVENLDFCLCGAAENAIVTFHAMDILLLNPPYGYEPREGNDYCSRSTVSFLDATEASLAENGWLFLVIPQNNLRFFNKKIYKNYKNFQVICFPEWESQWNQIIIIAQKKKSNEISEQQIFPDLGRELQSEFVEKSILVDTCQKACKTFKIHRLSELEIAAILAESGTPLLDQIRQRKRVETTPAMELSPTSYANLIVAGEIKGVSRQDEEWNIVAGKTTKEIIIREEEGEGVTIQRQLEVHRQEINVLTVDGNILSLTQEKTKEYEI